MIRKAARETEWGGGREGMFTCARVCGRERRGRREGWRWPWAPLEAGGGRTDEWGGDEVGLTRLWAGLGFCQQTTDELTTLTQLGFDRWVAICEITIC
jgi:hypothetical protein